MTSASVPPPESAEPGAQPGSTRERLLEAAYELLVEKGFHAATLQGVARRAGLTPGAIYANFENKHELMVVAVLDHWLLDEQDAVTVRQRSDALDPADHGPLTMLLAQHLAAPATARHRLLTEVAGAIVRDAGAGTPLTSAVELVAETARTAVDAAKADGQMDPELGTDAMVAVIVNLYLGAITSKALGLPQPPLDEVTALFDTLSRGFASPPPSD